MMEPEINPEEKTGNGAAPQAGATEIPAEVRFVSDVYGRTKDAIQQVVIGNSPLIELTLAGLFTGGHILIEGVPGVAKTLTAKLVARCMDIAFTRIQFTPDLMPSDLIGTNVYSMQKSDFVFRKGPLFSNLVLIDEINRAPAKTQAALFEVMEERQITVDGTTYLLPPPFFVVATQNPVEHEGIYKLPEAQLDRFVFRLKTGYPGLEEEQDILKRFREDAAQEMLKKVEPVVRAEDIARCIAAVNKVHIKDELLGYIAAIVHGTRNNGDLFLGASPRASLAILRTSKAIAALRGRDFVTPDDIRTVCGPVLNHRIILTPEKEMEGATSEDITREIIENIEVPR